MKTIFEILVNHSKTIPDKTAIIDDKGSYSYKNLIEKIFSIMNWLKDNGVLEQDRVLLEAIPTFEYVATYFAIHGIGAIVVPIDKDNKTKNWTIDYIQPKILIKIDDIENFKNINVIFKEQSFNNIKYPTEDMIADILFTSGTTNKPKGVMLTHKNIKVGAENVIEGTKMTIDDIELVGLPICHAQALGSLRALMYTGATVVLQDGFASIKETNDNLVKYNCTGIGLNPTIVRIFKEMSKNRLDLLFKNIRFMEIGTAPLSLYLRKYLIEMLPNVSICITYGITETPRIIYFDLNKHKDKILSAGKPMKQVKVYVLDEDDDIIQSSKNNIGEIVIAGEMNMKGYYNNQEATNEVLKNGYYYTNDIGYLDEDGFLYLTGRKNDLLNVGGNKFGTLDIENQASLYELINECSCIGVKDEIFGEVPVLFYTTLNNIEVDENEMKKYLSKNLESYKIPKKIIKIDSLPKNYMGKVDKNKLLNIWEMNYQK